MWKDDDGKEKESHLDPRVYAQPHPQRSPYSLSSNPSSAHRKHEWINTIKNTPLSFSFPSTLPNGTLARPNNGILNVNRLDDGFSAVVCPSGGVFTCSNVYWCCAAGGVVGSDGTLSSTDDGGVLLSEREAVYTGGRSVISGVGDGS
jgi:hypothetical protein